MELKLENIKSYCIHLKTRRDREKNMFKELDSFTSNYEIFDAIKMSPGYKGTSESFKSIIKKAKGEKLKQVLIFEDDVRFTSKKSRSKFQIAINSLPDKWDILLGGVYTSKNKPEESKYNDHISILGDFSSLHCILINESCYDKILEHNPNKDKHLDRYLGRLAKSEEINAYLTYPMIAIQYNTYSNNVKRHVNYDKLLNKFKLFDFKKRGGGGY